MPDKYWFKFRHPLSQLLWIERAQAQSLLLPKGINRGITRASSSRSNPDRSSIRNRIIRGFLPRWGDCAICFYGFFSFFSFLVPSCAKQASLSFLAQVSEDKPSPFRLSGSAYPGTSPSSGKQSLMYSDGPLHSLCSFNVARRLHRLRMPSRSFTLSQSPIS